jgi:hypothetical protein
LGKKVQCGQCQKLFRALADFSDLSADLGPPLPAKMPACPEPHPTDNPLVSYSLAAFIVIAAALLVALGAEIARGQISSAEAMWRQEAAQAAERAELAANNAAKRQASIMKRQRNASLKQWERMVVPLSSQDLAEWKKVKGCAWHILEVRNQTKQGDHCGRLL